MTVRKNCSPCQKWLTGETRTVKTRGVDEKGNHRFTTRRVKKCTKHMKRKRTPTGKRANRKPREERR